jgi:hypothetical protein
MGIGLRLRSWDHSTIPPFHHSAGKARLEHRISLAKLPLWTVVGLFEGEVGSLNLNISNADSALGISGTELGGTRSIFRPSSPPYGPAGLVAGTLHRLLREPAETSVVTVIPFCERIWCSVLEYMQVTGEGHSKIHEKIRTGEIVSKRDGRRRRIHVP